MDWLNGSCDICFDCQGIGHEDDEIESRKMTKGGLAWLSIGDYGYRMNVKETEIADKMEEVASKEKINFVLNTGDNFYEP